MLHKLASMMGITDGLIMTNIQPIIFPRCPKKARPCSIVV